MSSYDPGLYALVAAASAMWIILISLVVYQFRRQRRLADELERMQVTLSELKDSADRAEEE